jgi:RNA polymerase sigma-70 factor (ECF subfamily)
VKKHTIEHLFLRFRRRGDASALGEVFDRTAEDLFKLALYLGPEATDAEDLVQATYLTAIEAAHNFESGRRLLPWLLGILSNHARKARDQFRRRTGIDGDRLTVPSSDIGLKDNPEINAEHAELHATLGKAISRLPQPYRQVLVLHLEHGLNARKISKVLERPAGTVRSQVVRGLEQLRRLLPLGLTAGALVMSPGHVLAGVRQDVLRTAENSALTATNSFWIATHTVAVAVAASIVVLLCAAWGLGPNDDATRTIVVSDPVVPSDRDLPSASDAPRELRTPIAPRPRVLPAARTAKLRVALTVGGDPAPVGVLVELLAATRPHTLIHLEQMRGVRRFAESDGNGVASFLDVPVGKAVILLAGSLVDQTSVVVTATEETRVAFPLPRLRRLAGVVISANGQPARGASIWMSTTANEEAVGAVAARSDEQGKFAFYAPAGRVHVWAVQTGAGPSAVAAALAARPIELRLTPPGGSLTCRVENGTGQLLEGAVVQVMPLCADREPFAPVFGRSIATGVARLADLPPGPAVVVVRKPGFATVTRGVHVTVGDNATTVRLPIGARIEGTVRRGDGTSWPGISLLAEVADGSVGAHDAKLRRVMAVSDSEGRFSLVDLPHGFVRVRVVDVTGCTWIASRRFDLRAGQRVNWDPRDAAHQKIRGRVIDLEGRPVAGYAIMATPMGGGQLVDQYRRRVARSGADGTFALRPMERRVAYHVGVFKMSRKIREVDALALGLSLRPGDKVHTFRVNTKGATHDQGITGSLRGPRGSTVASVDVFLRRVPLRSWEKISARSEEFRVDVPPGRYEIGFRVENYGTLFLPPVQVVKGKHTALETIHLPELGVIDVRIEGEARFTITDRRGRVLLAKNVNRRLRRSLPPGKYVATLGREGVVPERRVFTVRSRRATELELKLCHGRRCALKFLFDPLDNTFDGLGKLHLVLRAKSGAKAGQVIVDTHVTPRRLDAFDWQVALLPGEYQVVATSVWGGQCDHSFRVVDGVGDVTVEAVLELAQE